MAFKISCSSDVFLKKKRARYYLVGNHTCCKLYAAVKGLSVESMTVQIKGFITTIRRLKYVFFIFSNYMSGKILFKNYWLTIFFIKVLTSTSSLLFMYKYFANHFKFD